MRVVVRQGFYCIYKLCVQLFVCYDEWNAMSLYIDLNKTLDPISTLLYMTDPRSFDTLLNMG